MRTVTQADATEQPATIVETGPRGGRSPESVISLIASATEIVAALGCLDRLVGRSHECDYPPQVAELPVCSRSRVDVNASSREIDDQVKAAAHAALSVYEVDVEMLDRLHPDLIVTQTQCEVCAVSLKDVELAVSRMIRSTPQIVTQQPMDLADVFADIRRIGAALGVDETAEQVVGQMQSRLEEVRSISRQAESKTRVACIEWIDPLMSAGNWVPELVEIAGGENLFGEAGQHSPWMSWAELRAADPDVIVIMPCGFDISRSLSEMPPLLAQPGWDDLTAVRSNRVVMTDGNQYLNRPGPRLADSAEILAEILHPDLFEPRHQGHGWQLLPAASA